MVSINTIGSIVSPLEYTLLSASLVVCGEVGIVCIMVSIIYTSPVAVGPNVFSLGEIRQWEEEYLTPAALLRTPELHDVKASNLYLRTFHFRIVVWR